MKTQDSIHFTISLYAIIILAILNLFMTNVLIRLIVTSTMVIIVTVSIFIIIREKNPSLQKEELFEEEN